VSDRRKFTRKIHKKKYFLKVFVRGNAEWDKASDVTSPVLDSSKSLIRLPTAASLLRAERNELNIAISSNIPA